MSTEKVVRDVVVVGAGVTGLVAATQLRRRGYSVLVLEARDRVGGRTWTDTIDGVRLEIGGQWISPDQTAISSLAQELGLRLFDRYRDGDSVYCPPGGERVRFQGDFPVSEATGAEMKRLIDAIEDLTAEIDPDRPWEHPDAARLDSLSFEDWLREHSDDEEARRCIAHYIGGGMLTKPTHAFSTLQAMLMAASAGRFEHLVDENFLLDKRVEGGMQQVSILLAEQLGDDLVLNAPVRTLEWTQDSVTATAEGPAGSVVVEARRALVAVPPNLYSRISYVPPLPRRQHQMHQHQSFGFVIKVHAAYPTPFWREDGRSGTCFGPGRLVPEIYDNTNHEEDCGILVGFVSDVDADGVFELDAEARKQRILDEFVAYLGEEARTPSVYYESDWGSEEWTRGAYGTSFDLGGLHRYGKDMRAPVGAIHWGSSDLAGLGFQHVDGAVRVGQDSAERIDRELGGGGGVTP